MGNSNIGYLNTKNKLECFGCEACAQICPKQAIKMVEDKEGFRYPVIDRDKCIQCKRCNYVCPKEAMPEWYQEEKFVFGGYIKDERIRNQSTSGGAFSAIADAWCDENYVIFGAAVSGLQVYHTYITDKKELHKFRKSKYAQSHIGNAYEMAKKLLLENKKVLFSGTPCHIAGLRAYLKNTDQRNLLTIEVICEGVPSPLYIRKYNQWCIQKYHFPIMELDYRYKDRNKWDFQVMLTKLKGVEMKQDRWFNPFWSIWLEHLMSRPSCYKCPFTTEQRGADITLGDLWGVHIYCPELYGNNGGTSLLVCNTEKGKQAVQKARKSMYGHELDFYTAIKYQSPLRQNINLSANRKDFMRDLASNMDYKTLNKKWAKRPTIKLLWQKYIWGNRQKAALWNVKKRLNGVLEDKNA